MADRSKQKAVFEFLRERARSGEPFSADDVNEAIGWEGKTAATYLSKHYRDYLAPVSRGKRKVLPEFRRVTWEEFQELVTQVRHPFASYDRSTYESVVIYEFLMPLTREDKLRKALDELFYRDTLERRIGEIEPQVMERIIPRGIENDTDYTARIIQFIDERIGGFSISHVSGRFRVGPVLTRSESIARISKDAPYLIDETTAVVRFIVPCMHSRKKHETAFPVGVSDDGLTAEVRNEIRQIRGIFLEVFVEAIVPSIRGEKLIWMLETTPVGQRLYELSLTEPSADDTENDDGDE